MSFFSNHTWHPINASKLPIFFYTANHLDFYLCFLRQNQCSLQQAFFFTSFNNKKVDILFFKSAVEVTFSIFFCKTVNIREIIHKVENSGTNSIKLLHISICLFLVQKPMTGKASDLPLSYVTPGNCSGQSYGSKKCFRTIDESLEC